MARDLTFDEIAALHNNPVRMHVPLTDRQITAIGQTIVQWSILDDQIQQHVARWRLLPNLPNDLRKKQIDHRAGSRISFLRTLGPYRMEHKPQILAEFLRVLSNVEKCKNRREWFAHGSFHVLDNQDPDRVGIIYKGHKFKFATAKIENLSLEISILAGWFFNLEWRIDEEIHRALHEIRLQLDR